jgi:hypothetical protein
MCQITTSDQIRYDDILDFDLRRLFTYILSTALIGYGISGANGCSIDSEYYSIRTSEDI